jgi:hypothetical protein
MRSAASTIGSSITAHGCWSNARTTLFENVLLPTARGFMAPSRSTRLAYAVDETLSAPRQQRCTRVDQRAHLVLRHSRVGAGGCREKSLDQLVDDGIG